MKKISLFLVFVFICLSASDKQEQKSVMDILISKEWNMQGMSDKTFSEKYTRTEKYAYFNGQLLGIQDYYLSDTIDGAFNPKKIGLAKNGKYIISKTKDSSISTFEIYEIISISNDFLEIRYIEHTHTLKFK
ncbi:MAG: hypothetical protein ACFNL2_10755 [Tannerella forsythia]|uniref:hypothetical protein n=1 Tax=Tannerella forsythia TaxID=28112 RepID=UPI00361BC447